jgi:hypothetical protein
MRYINGKSVRTKKIYSNLYVYFYTNYTDEIIDKLKELYLYFNIVDIYVYDTEVEVRFYRPLSYIFIAFLYNYLKENDIDNFKIGMHYNSAKKDILTSKDIISFLKKTNYMF